MDLGIDSSLFENVIFARDASGNPIISVGSVFPGREYVRVPHQTPHAPKMEFGFNGPGPEDAARSILWYLYGREIAELLYIDFKEEVVSKVPSDGDALAVRDLTEWVSKRLVERV